MKMSDLFIGRIIYWALAAIVVLILAVLGHYKIHVRYFVPFQWTVLALAVFIVAVVLFVYKPGERITREPIETQDDTET